MYTVSETYELPSKGKIYGVNVPEVVTLRSMTTENEQQRTTITDYPYKLLSDIIDDCMVDEIGMSAYDMHIGDYLFLLYKLRVVTYGNEYKILSKCPHCGLSTPEIVDLDELPAKVYDENLMSLLEFELPVSGDNIKITFQTPRMLDTVRREIREYRQKGGTVDKTLTYTLMHIIQTVNGKKLDYIQLEDYITNMQMRDTNTIIAHADKINKSIGLDPRLDVKCNICGGTYATVLPMTQEFFRPALDI